MQQAEIQIRGMSCGHCVANVTRALHLLEGVVVKEVKVGSARLSYDPAVASPARILGALEEEGYGAELSRA